MFVSNMWKNANESAEGAAECSMSGHAALALVLDAQIFCDTTQHNSLRTGVTFPRYLEGGNDAILFPWRDKIFVFKNISIGVHDTRLISIRPISVSRAFVSKTRILYYLYFNPNFDS